MTRTATCSCGWIFRVTDGAPGGRVPCLMCGASLEVPSRTMPVGADGRGRLPPLDAEVLEAARLRQRTQYWLWGAGIAGLVSLSLAMTSARQASQRNQRPSSVSYTPPASSEDRVPTEGETARLVGDLASSEAALDAEMDLQYRYLTLRPPDTQSYDREHQALYKRGEFWAIEGEPLVRVGPMSGPFNACQVEILEGSHTGRVGWVWLASVQALP